MHGSERVKKKKGLFLSGVTKFGLYSSAVTTCMAVKGLKKEGGCFYQGLQNLDFIPQLSQHAWQ